MNLRADHRLRSVAFVTAGLLWVIASLVSCAGAARVGTARAVVGKGASGEAASGLAAVRPLRGRTVIQVGQEPGPLLLTEGGRTLACLNVGDHSLSLIDLRSARETARICLPVRERDHEGKETFGYLTDMALDRDSGTLWIVSNEGQVFSLDLGTHAYQTRFSDARYDFSAVAWDPGQRRLLLAGDERGAHAGVRHPGTLYGFRSGRMESLLTTALGIHKLHRVGSTLLYISGADAVAGLGAWDSAVGVVDLAADRVIFEHALEAGDATDVAVLPDGRIWIADNSMARVLELSRTGELMITRHLGLEGGGPDALAAAGERVLVSLWLPQEAVVYEYGRVAGGFSPAPLWEYRVARGRIQDILALPGGGVALSLHTPDQVLLLGRDTRQPFSGFPAE